MISKELLSEVLGHSDICNERIIQNKLLYMCKNDGMIDYEYEYNIYELAHKCKEWAYNKGLMLVSGYYPNGNIYCSTSNILKGIFNESRADTEVEAVIKATEWILKELKK